MKNKANKLVGLILSIILCVFLFPAFQVNAEDGKGYGKGDREKRINKMHEKLGLSEDQRGALKAHKQKHRDGMKSLKEEMKAKRKALREEMRRDDFDVRKVRALNQELKSLHNNVSDRRLEGVIGVREILTTEQFSKFRELKKDHKSDRKEKRGEFKDRYKERRKERNGE